MKEIILKYERPPLAGLSLDSYKPSAQMKSAIKRFSQSRATIITEKEKKGKSFFYEGFDFEAFNEAQILEIGRKGYPRKPKYNKTMRKAFKKFNEDL